jgi:heat shock protein HtpX
MINEVTANKRKTALLFVGFFAFIAIISWIFGQAQGNYSSVIAGLVIASVYSLISYFASSKIALSMNGAKEIQKRDNPKLWRTVENLAITEGLPMPRVYIIDDPGLNAFATGRNPENAHVAITTGLLDVLDYQELQGVMAHELGHIKNYDIRVAMVAFALFSVVSILADFFLRMSFFGGFRNSDDDDSSASALFGMLALVAMILAPIVATVIQLALSRQREYLADATGAEATRYPEGLARALEKIRDYGGGVLKRQNSSTAHFFISNPLRGRSFSSLFSTHPPLDERIAKLRNMGF